MGSKEVGKRGDDMEDICNKPLVVFDEEVVQFLGDLSAEILKSPLARQYPDLSAFAFLSLALYIIHNRYNMMPF